MKVGYPMKKKALALCLVLVLCAILASCALFTPGGDENAAPSHISVGLSFAFKDTPYHYAIEDYLVKAADSYYDRTQIRIDFLSKSAEKDTLRQAQDIRELVDSGIDVLMIYPNDSEAIHECIAYAHSKKVPVLMFDRDASATGEQADAFIGFDTFQQAYMTGVAIFELMEKDYATPSVILVNGDMKDENAANRHRGFMQAIDQYQADVIAEIDSRWDNDIVEEELYAVLKEYPHVNCILSAGDYLLPGIENAMQSAYRFYPYGDDKHVYFGSQDGMPKGVELMQGGYIDFILTADLWPIAQKTIPLIVSLERGEFLDRDKFLIEGRLLSKSNVNTLENLWSREYLTPQ